MREKRRDREYKYIHIHKEIGRVEKGRMYGSAG